MPKRNRHFVSIYFNDSQVSHRKKRDVNVAFSEGDPLYGVCRKLGSTGIKDAIGIHSYSRLIQEAGKEERSVGNYIKHRLRARFGNEEAHTAGRTRIQD